MENYTKKRKRSTFWDAAKCEKNVKNRETAKPSGQACVLWLNVFATLLLIPLLPQAKNIIIDFIVTM